MTPGRHRQIAGNLVMQGEIDEGIRPLVRAMNHDGLTTLGSCEGHGRSAAWVDVMAEDFDSLRLLFHRIQCIEERFAVFVELTAVTSLHVATSSDPKAGEFCFCFAIGDEQDPPDSGLLRAIARSWRRFRISPSRVYRAR